MINFSDVSEQGGFQVVLSGLHDDEIGKLCKSDPTIRLVGSRLYEKDRTKPGKTMEVKKSVRASMRMLARLFLYFKDEENGSLDREVKDMCNREYFKS